MGKYLVLRVREGNLIKKSTVKGVLIDVIKKEVQHALNSWNPLNSDLYVMKETLNLPNLGIEKEITLYIISYDNEWVNEELHEKELTVIMPYSEIIDDAAINAIVKLIT